MGNPGPGGWAFIITKDGSELASSSGSELKTTNNKMELQAVIEALTWVLTHQPESSSIELHTDSQYVKNGITVWIHNWKRNGWRTANKAPVKNKEYWLALDEKAQKLPISWNWVKGHAGNHLNERCDELVKEAMYKIAAL